MDQDFIIKMNQIQKLGKEFYGPKFRLYPEDKTIWHMLYAYFYRHEDLCKMYKLDLRKGILLIGPVGVGKTSMLNLMNRTLPEKLKFGIKSANEIALTFATEGHAAILRYGKSFTRIASYSIESRSLCIDDIGTESNIKHFGNEVNAIQDILQLRYETFITCGVKTHCTTNLKSCELGIAYGDRVLSRIQHMLNQITIDANNIDKRNQC